MTRPPGSSRRAAKRSAPHVRRNRVSWDAGSDEYQRDHARQLNRFSRPVWGIWAIPEARLQILGDVAGKDVLEFGCGGAQWSIALARRKARPVGMDLSSRQLEHARRLMARAGVRFPLVNASAEQTPFRDGSFDVVFCDHGAMTFADPYRTVPEAARVLRPGGLFAFNMASPLVWLCWGEGEEPPTGQLRRDYFGMRTATWETSEFQLTYGDWVRLFRRNGFVVEDLIELRPGPKARTTYDLAPFDWARRWPAENIWRLRKDACGTDARR